MCLHERTYILSRATPFDYMDDKGIEDEMKYDIWTKNY